MAGERQMVPGFNHNVKHRGTPYHVQTEDSGIDNPRIITHLFVGGNVIASKKTSYADIVGAENLSQVVRELMEEQHKEMLRNLISGVYDGTEEDVAAKACAFQPGEIASQPDRASAPATGTSAPARVAAPRPTEAAKPAEPPRRVEAGRPAEAARAPEAAKASASRPPPIPRPPAPNPKSAAAPAAAQAPDRRAARPAAGASAAAAAPPTRPVPAQRPAPAMAAQPNGSTASRRRDVADAIFGEDLISEKSLDEVILSYLAEDLAEKT